MLKKILIVLGVIVFVALGVIIYKHYTHWSMQKIEIMDAESLPITVLNVKDGIPFADNKAKEWNKNAVLSNVVVDFEGRDRINEQVGVINYHYFVENHDKIGLPYAVCWVAIDTLKQEKVRFSAYGGKNLEGMPIDTSLWVIDIPDVFNIIKNKGYLEVINQYNNPKIVIRAYPKFWSVGIFLDGDSTYENISITIDYQTGYVLQLNDKLQNR